MNRPTIHAVLTGDIVNSTQLDPIAEKKLLEELKQILHPYKFEFFRGDSFQVYMRDPQKSLEVALRCRTAAIRIRANDTDNSSETIENVAKSDVRVSIGIGNVIMPVGVPGAGKGAAFLLSGRSFDEMQKAGTRLSVASENGMANIAFEVIADYVNSIYEGMTAKQAEVIDALLKGGIQQQVAADLGKSKSTISQIVHAGRWPEIEKLLGQYEKLLNQLLPEFNPLKQFNQ